MLSTLKVQKCVAAPLFLNGAWRRVPSGAASWTLSALFFSFFLIYFFSFSCERNLSERHRKRWAKKKKSEPVVGASYLDDRRREVFGSIIWCVCAPWFLAVAPSDNLIGFRFRVGLQRGYLVVATVPKRRPTSWWPQQFLSEMLCRLVRKPSAETSGPVTI